MELKKVEVGITYSVNYNDLDDFINHHYPNLNSKFEFVADEEMGNDSEKVIEVDGKIDEWNEEELESIFW